MAGGRLERNEKIRKAGRMAAYLDSKYKQKTENPYNPYRQQMAFMTWQSAYDARGEGEK